MKTIISLKLIKRWKMIRKITLKKIIEMDDKFNYLDTKERLDKLETKFKRHEHKGNGVVIKEGR